eukprot:5477121-Prymnesium_polylepis.1
MTCLSIHAHKSELLERSGRRGSGLCDRTPNPCTLCDRDRAALEEVCRVERRYHCAQRTKKVKVTRVLRVARAERCEMLEIGVLRAGHQPVSARRLAYLREGLVASNVSTSVLAQLLVLRSPSTARLTFSFPGKSAASSPRWPRSPRAAP